MGVWQVTEDQQPFIGQWDAVTDSFWDGTKWVPALANATMRSVVYSDSYSSFWNDDLTLDLGTFMTKYFKAGEQKSDTNQVITSLPQPEAAEYWGKTSPKKTDMAPQVKKEPQSEGIWNALQSMY